MTEWISVKDRLPEARWGGLSDDVLTINELNVQKLLCWSGTGWCKPDGSPANTRCFPVTHWMPLPKPPKGE